MNPKAKNFRRSELPRRYIAKVLYGWDDKKFKDKYLKKLKRNQNRSKSDRKIDEKESMKKLKESLEWNKINKKISRTI